MKEITNVSATVGAQQWTLETGRLAGLADGAVVATLGDTQVLATAAASRSAREGQSFFPLTVDIEEKMYAVGKIPGSFFRREGRAGDQAIQLCRLIDRPLRPAFPEGFRNEVHVVGTVFSADGEHSHDIVALNASSAALTISGIPFDGPIGAVRLGLVAGNWIVNPTYQQLDEAVFDLVVAARRNDAGEIDVMMVEAGATEHAWDLIEEGHAKPNEDALVAALEAAKEPIGELIDLQLALRGKVSVEPIEYELCSDYEDEVYNRVEVLASDRLRDAVTIADKRSRSDAVGTLADEAVEQLDEEFPNEDKAIRAALRTLEKRLVRQRIVTEGKRIDGRCTTDIRPLLADVGIIPRAHGSGLFQRGETQVLNICTLGMLRMAQPIDTIHPEESKRYMHNYNMPPYSTGEPGFMRGPKRREIGHGALAERAVLPVVPPENEFPYALRLVSEALASNGSTSMASVCASVLALMDAGVPIKAPVAGIAMGLVHDGDTYVTLTDILGAEDAFGDMDFKVAGTADFVTALQLDTKIQGLPSNVLADALAQAKDARIRVLAVMAEAIAGPRGEVSSTAPRIETLKVPVDKIGEVIGPKGKVIQEIQRETGAEIDVEEDGTIRVGARNTESLDAAVEWISAIANPPVPEIGKEYPGKVVNITDFGAFVNIIPGRDGLVHISKLGTGARLKSVHEVLKIGDEMTVRVDDVDMQGRVNLFPLSGPEGAVGTPEEVTERLERERQRGGGPRGGGDRDRDRDRGPRGGGDRDRGRDRGPRGGGDRDRDRDRGPRGGGDRDRDRGGGSGDSGDRTQRRESAGRQRGAGDGGSGGRDRDRHRGGGGGDRNRDRQREGRSRDSAGTQKSDRQSVSFEDRFEEEIQEGL